MGSRDHGGDQAGGEPMGHGRAHVRPSRYTGALAGWLLMVGGPWVVHFNMPPVLLHVTLPEKYLCGGGAFDRSAFPTDNPISVHE